MLELVGGANFDRDCRFSCSYGAESSASSTTMIWKPKQAVAKKNALRYIFSKKVRRSEAIHLIVCNCECAFCPVFQQPGGQSGSQMQLSEASSSRHNAAKNDSLNWLNRKQLQIDIIAASTSYYPTERLSSIIQSTDTWCCTMEVSSSHTHTQNPNESSCLQDGLSFQIDTRRYLKAEKNRH